MRAVAGVLAAAASAAAQGSVKCSGCFHPLSPKTPKCTGKAPECFSPTIKLGGCWTIPFGVRSVSAKKCTAAGVQFDEYATKDCSGPVNTTSSMKTGACANPAPGQAPAGVWAECTCQQDLAPLPTADPSGKYCGKVPVILDMAVTFNGDNSIDFYNNVKVAKQVIDCKAEKYTLKDGLITFDNIASTGDCMGDGIRGQGKDVSKYVIHVNSDGTLTFDSDGYPALKLKSC